jgi:hypothetical protein
MKKKEEQALLIFERKIFRRIYGSKYEDGERNSRMNRELEVMGKGENIVKCIKGQRISCWVTWREWRKIRCPKSSSLKTGRDETKRKNQERMERRNRRDLQVLEVRRWRELLIDMGKWRGIIRQAKAHNGL